MYLSISKSLYFALRIYFRPGQECAKCSQIATNKNATNFITLSMLFYHCIVLECL